MCDLDSSIVQVRGFEPKTDPTANADVFQGIVSADVMLFTRMRLDMMGRLSRSKLLLWQWHRLNMPFLCRRQEVGRNWYGRSLWKVTPVQRRGPPRIAVDLPRPPHQQVAIGQPPCLGRGPPHPTIDLPQPPNQQAAIGVPTRLGRGLTHTSVSRLHCGRTLSPSTRTWVSFDAGLEPGGVPCCAVLCCAVRCCSMCCAVAVLCGGCAVRCGAVR